MANSTPLLVESSDELTHVVPACEYVTQQLSAGQYPYQDMSLFVRARLFLLRHFVQIVEWVIGTHVYVANDLRELYSVDVRLRSLLHKLVRKKLVTSWEQVPCYPDAPAIIRYCVHTQFKTPFLRTVHNLSGYGTGTSSNEALFLALTEALERQSSFLWNEKSIVRGSYEELRAQGACSPTKFDTFVVDQRKTFKELGNVKDVDMHSFGWVRAHGLTDKSSYLIPAQLVSVLYRGEHPQEPLLFDPSSNAFAAGSTREQAILGAVCEAIERDALMGFWLNRIPPLRIRHESIPYPVVQKGIADLKRYGYELHFFDITTDLAVPSFAALLIDHSGETPISLSAVTGFDIERMMHKLIREIGKYAHYRVETNDTFGSANEERYLQVRSISERRNLWSRKEMQNKINFLLEGDVKELVPGETPTPFLNEKVALETVQGLLKAKQYTGYVVDVTSPEAREVGLFVVKVVLPDLIPAYFSEARQPLGVARLHEFPGLNGYGKPGSLNSVPHPFV